MAEILMRAQKKSPNTRLIDYCRDYVDTVNANITAFLKDKSRKMVLEMETMADQFDTFADLIGATGDLEAARADLAQKHNKSWDTE